MSRDFKIAGPKWSPTQAKSLASLNQMIAGVLALACFIAALGFVRKFIRLMRRGSSHPRTANLAS